MSATEAPPDLRSKLLAATLFAAMSVLAAIDLVTDLGGGTTVFHAIVEGAVIAIGGLAVLWIALQVRRLALEARELRVQARVLSADLDASRLDAARWQRDARDLIAGLSAAIDDQFARWRLSPAETEIALLLLKGLSHKEIAQLRGVGETTVRQQARALYRKAGLSGRNDLAAFFLEDLLGPRSPEAGSAARDEPGDVATADPRPARAAP